MVVKVIFKGTGLLELFLDLATEQTVLLYIMFRAIWESRQSADSHIA